MALPEIPILEGDYVRLEPLSHERADELSAACEDGKLHELWYTFIPSPAGM